MPFVNGEITLASCLFNPLKFLSFPFYKAINIVFNGVSIPITYLILVIVLAFISNVYLNPFNTL